MALRDFWNSIHEGGEVVVEPPDLSAASPAADDASLRAAVAELDAQWRLELAGEAPPLVMPVAIWALQLIHRACQFLVYREVEPEAVSAAMATPCPQPPSPEVCYSADLALRVLPDLLRLARATAPDDPLVTALSSVARQWPLSSVGEKLERADVSAFIDHPSLRTLYADRIIERGDVSRLDDPRVAAEVRRALGAHPDLAPTIARALRDDS